MGTRLAKIASFALHPLLMPLYVYVILLNSDAFYSFLIPLKVKLIVTGMVFLVTFLLPGSMIYFMLKKGIISSLKMEKREERIFPFMVTAICYYIGAYLVKYFQLPGFFYLFSLSSTMLVIICLLINFAKKISIHMAGIGGVTGTFLALSLKWVSDYRILLIILFLLAGIIGFSRLKLNAHRPVEVYLGYAAGIILMFGIFYFL